VYEGTQELRDGEKVQPKSVKIDSLLAAEQ
jgi:hypothetical protein